MNNDPRFVPPLLRRRPLAASLALALATAAVVGHTPVHAASAPSAAFSTDPYALRSDLRRSRAVRPAVRNTSTVASTRGGAIVPVTSCLDDGSAGTLRAVAALVQEGDTIDLSQLTCSTITLTQGPIDTSVLGENHVYDLTINGPGRDLLTIDGGGTSQIFVVGGFSSAKGRAIFNDLTIAHGDYSGGLAACITGFGGAVELNRVTVTDCHSRGTVPLVFGGAVDVTTLDMTDSVISNSSATATGINGTAVGGGTYASDSMTLVDSTVSGNTVSAPWGVNDGYLTIGGGIYSRGDLVLTRSTISGNSIDATNDGENARGGGIFVRGVATIDASTIDDNRADGSGGGLFKEIFSNYGEPPPPNDTRLTITNSTIYANGAGGSGAGIYSLRPTTVTSSTIVGNQNSLDSGAGLLFADASLPLEIQSSIFSSNSCGDCGSPPLFSDIATPDSQTPLTVQGANNIVLSVGTNITLPADTLATSPGLALIANNGGPTRTLALGAGSPAIDAGNNAAALEFDQRGEHFARESGTAADIGAFEVQQPPAGDVIFRDGFDGTGPVEYAHDDGDGDTNMGPPSSFDPDMLWGNYFTAQPGGEFITHISVAFGPTFPSLADGPVTFWLLQDVDADGDPRNAYAIASVQGTPVVFNDTFHSVNIAPTWVHGGFFVAASAKLQGGEDAPARVDTDGPGDSAWFFYAPDIAATIDDLASAPFGTRMDDPQFVIFPGAFMIRATGSASLL